MPQAARAFMLLMWVTRNDIGPQRRCLNLGTGALILDTPERLILEGAQHIVPCCFEQKGQR
ncbi:MAG: hypothetical protein MPN21_15905 [Thermoanaerobaculia bacterium]|nr:hypothetical protein [Thermoanaerobaculia bacterium]